MATALFNSIQSDVISLTKRPDLAGIISVAIRAATLKMHQSDFYYKDLHETGIEFAAAAYFQTLTVKDVIPLYRHMKYLRKCDATTTPYTPLAFMERLSPEASLDSYGVNREDVFYSAGNNIQIRSSTEEAFYLFGCYLLPNVVEASYDSWVAQEVPFAIVNEATRVVFKTIGYDEQAKNYEMLVAEQIAILKQSYIDDSAV